MKYHLIVIEVACILFFSFSVCLSYQTADWSLENRQWRRPEFSLTDGKGLGVVIIKLNRDFKKHKQTNKNKKQKQKQRHRKLEISSSYSGLATVCSTRHELHSLSPTLQRTENLLM